VVDAHDQQLATTLRHTLGATPFRRPVTTFAIPAATPDHAAADPTEPPSPLSSSCESMCIPSSACTLPDPPNTATCFYT
jgi:hypothetical protein